MRALLLLIATSAAADPRHEIHVGSHVRALHASSANALTEDSLAGPEFGYAYRLPLAVGAIELWGTGHLAFGFASGQMFQTLDTDVASTQVTAGIRARRALWRRFLAADARFDLGAQHVQLALEDRAHREASDTGWGAVSTAAAGIELGYEGQTFGLTMRLELGYTFTQAVALDARSEGAPDDTLELDRMAASIGHLDLGGKFFAATVTTRF